MRYSVSIVSHGSGRMIALLLDDLRRTLGADSEVLVTLNFPEDESFLERAGHLRLHVLRNPRPKGFGDNHNSAFALSTGRTFFVVNPDIRLAQPPFDALESCLADDGASAGAAAPLVLSPTGRPEDSVRRFPTAFRLARRVLTRHREADYSAGATAVPVDWTAGMFVAFDRDAYTGVQGFDTRYFMYFEDADICRRLWRAGRRVTWVPQASVTHDARRASHGDLRHLRWHLRSALRYLSGV